MALASLDGQAVGVMDPETLCQELAGPLREARGALLAVSETEELALFRFARARADEMPQVSHDDKQAWRERFVHEAASTFACEVIGPAENVEQAYEEYVLTPMREVMNLIDLRLGEASVPDKLALHRHISAGRREAPEEGGIRSAINLLIASTVPGSDMNY